MQYSLLNLLRFLAALVVVVHHFGYATPPFDKGIFKNLIGNGHFAVTFFFALSGFVMVISNQKINFSSFTEKLRFWKKRGIRLLPTYYLGMLIFISYWIYTDTPLYWNEIIQNIIGVQAWSLNPYAELNPPGWSISAEFFFYLSTPFTLSFISKKNFRITSIILITIWATTVVVFIVLWINHEGGRILFNAFPLLHIGTFLIGILTGKYWLRKKENLVFLKTHWILLSTILLTLICVSLSSVFHGVQIPIYAPLFGILIYLLVLLEHSHNKIKLRKLFNFLGHLSYPIYILHWPVIKFYHHFLGSENSIFWLIKYSCSLVLFCIVTYLLMELLFKKTYKSI